VAAWAPADRILVETDAPFLAPVPYRGKTNEPGFVRFTAEAVAELRGIPSLKLAGLTTQNLEALCGWAPSS
jgi:TatD DNase family protein